MTGKGNFKMRANTCPYFKNADLLVSSAQNIDIMSGSNTSDYKSHYFSGCHLEEIWLFVTGLSHPNGNVGESTPSGNCWH